MREYLKLVLGRVSRSILRLFYPFFYVKSNRIIFSSYNGTQYSCNPKYISEYLQNNFEDEFEIIWVFNNVDEFKDIEQKKIKIIKNKSLKWIYYTMTSKFGITNTGVNSFIPLREKQVFINTWHGGGCYKKVEGSDKRKKQFYKLKIDKVSHMTRYFLSSSSFFSENVIRKNFLYDGEILNIGMPRNDILFNNHNETSIKVRDQLGISKDSFIVLYAPSWREKNKALNFELNILELKKHVEKKFKKECTVLYRAHHLSNKSIYHDTIDVSNYKDMQELMCASDMLITDFSSSIWDYSFTFKPCLLLIPDLNEYIDQVGFEVDIWEWGFPVCTSNEELCEKILNFNMNDFKIAMDKHHKSLDSYEIGQASKLICEKIKLLKDNN